MAQEMREYEFKLKDGSSRYEFVSCNADMQAFMRMHDAVSCSPVRPLTNIKPLSKTRLAEIRAITDDMIDLSDIPEQTAQAMAGGKIMRFSAAKK